MKRAEFLKVAKKVDVVIWRNDIRADESYYEVVDNEGLLATFDTLEDAESYCVEHDLTYLRGVE